MYVLPLVPRPCLCHPWLPSSSPASVAGGAWGWHWQGGEQGGQTGAGWESWEVALIVYTGWLCTNLRPQEHFGSVGGNLGEEQKRGATLGIT